MIRSVSLIHANAKILEAYWGAYIEPVFLVGALDDSLLASFGLGWGVTVSAGLASYPLDTIRYASISQSERHADYVRHSRRMMMSSGSGVHYKSMFDAGSQVRSMHTQGIYLYSKTNYDRSSPRRVVGHSLKELVLTFFVVLLVLECWHSTTSFNVLYLERFILVVCISFFFFLNLMFMFFYKDLDKRNFEKKNLFVENCNLHPSISFQIEL